MPKLGAQEYFQQLSAAIIERSEKGEVLPATDLEKGFVQSYAEVWQRGRYVRVQLQKETLDWPFGWVPKGRHAVVLRSAFRGYPPNRERERSLPWFVLSQFHGVLLGPRSQDEETILKAAKAARGRALEPVTLPGIPYPMFVGASHQPAEIALKQAGDIQRHYRRWEQLTPKVMDSLYPLFFGRFPHATLLLMVDPERIVSDYADLVADFLKALDDVERAFGSPPISEILPSPLRETPDQVLTMFVRCPKCGEQEPPVRVKSEGKNAPVRSSRCRVPIFASDPSST